MNNASCPRRAFTLIELLVSMAVLTLLVVFVTSMVNSVSKIWSSGEQRVEIYQNGRAILDQIARDLAPTLTSSSLQTVQNISTTSLLNGSNTVQVTNSDNLFWQAPGTTNTYSNIYELGYVLVKPGSGTALTYQLQRFLVAPNTRYPTPASSGSRTYQIFDAPFNAVTAPWLTNMTATNFQSSLSTLSSGVLGFWVRFLDRNGDPVPWLKNSNDPRSITCYSNTGTVKFNSAAAFDAAILGTSNSFQYTQLTDVTGATVTSATASTVAVNAANRLPTSVELTIVTIDQRSLKLPNITIPDPPASTLPANVPTDIGTYLNTLTTTNKLATAQMFSRIVRLQNGTD